MKEIDELKRNGSAMEKSPDSEHIEKMKLEEIDRLASVAVDALEEKKAVDVEDAYQNACRLCRREAERDSQHYSTSHRGTRCA